MSGAYGHVPARAGRMRTVARRSGEGGVGGGLEVGVQGRGLAGFEHALGEHDDGQVLVGVDEPGGAEAPGPPVGPAVQDRLAEAPRAALEEVRAQAAACLLLRGGGGVS